MKKLIILLVSIIISSGCVSNNPDRFSYEMDGKSYNVLYSPILEHSLEWIKENTPQDAVIASWWDYGHMIRGIGKRDVIVFSPSQEILNTTASYARGEVYDPNTWGELSNHIDIKNVALILTTTSPEQARELMRNYNSEYIFVYTGDEFKGHVLYQVSGIEAESTETGNIPHILNNNSLFYRMIQKEEIDGFNRVYSDSSAVIYKIS